MVTVERDGSPSVEWSILDTGEGAKGTIVCVHGNPTWGYVWRGFLETLAPDWRVVAVDQSGMGWSERTGPRRLAERVAELVDFCRQHTAGPIVLVAHDWGGPVVLGAVPSLDVRAVILGNTGVALPEGTPMPPLIGVARRFVDLICRRTPLFVGGTAAMTDKEHRRALRAPYGRADRRDAVAGFVEDIAVTEGDPSWDALQRSADAVAALEVPLLLVWGGRDPVFGDRFLADLQQRAPHADVHRFPEAAHLVPLDAPMADVASVWLDDVLGAGDVSHRAVAVATNDVATFAPITNSLLERAEDRAAAYSDRSGSVSWQDLARDARAIAGRLVGAGLVPGDRVAMLVPPGADMLRAAYGVWLAGGVLVVADRGLGPKGLRTMLRGAHPDWVYGTPRTLTVARALGWTPGARPICTRSFPGAIGPKGTGGRSVQLPEITAEMDAAVVHTSGSTGPAKPVRYLHGALAAQRDVVRSSFDVPTDTGFLTSFAPFILLGPALGVPCVLPDIDVTRPADLDFDRCQAAIVLSGADVAWLSPASARRIVETAAGRRLELRLVMLAGAPIPTALAADIEAVTGADVRSPWGMTEAMPITDGIGATRRVDGGTVTGAPLPGAEVLVVPVDDASTDPLPAGEWGELAVSAPWMFEGYEQQWSTTHATDLVHRGHRFHRTGDLGCLDADGVVLQLGRVQHAIATAAGLVPSVLVETPLIEALERQVAAVGVGPRGTQAVVIVVASDGDLRLADRHTTAVVRGRSSFDVAAVLEGELPVDIRHQSKIRREVLATSATHYLAGR